MLNCTMLDRARFRLRMIRAALKVQPVAGGSPEGDPPPAAPPANQATATSPPGDGGQPEQPKERLFTQAEVDRIIEERLKRAEPKYQELRQKAEAFDKLQEEKLSELERERKAREKAEKEAAERIEAANRRLIQAAVLAEATKQQAIKPEHMHRLIDLDGVTVGDDGQVTGVEEAVKAFLDANPEYVGKRAVGSADQGARKGSPTQLTREDLARMSPEEIRKATAEGRLNHLLGA